MLLVNDQRVLSENLDSHVENWMVRLEQRGPTFNNDMMNVVSAASAMSANNNHYAHMFSCLSYIAILDYVMV